MARLQPSYRPLLTAILSACDAVYGDGLVTLAVFGSTGRGTATAQSDIDLLVIADPLPSGRVARVEQFEAVERAVQQHLDDLARQGRLARLSPIFKTPREAERGSLLFLDMIDDAVLLRDRDGFFAAFLGRFARRLKELGARRVQRANTWFWDLNPDYRQGEVFEL